MIIVTSLVTTVFALKRGSVVTFQNKELELANGFSWQIVYLEISLRTKYENMLASKET